MSQFGLDLYACPSILAYYGSARLFGNDDCFMEISNFNCHLHIGTGEVYSCTQGIAEIQAVKRVMEGCIVDRDCISVTATLTRCVEGITIRFTKIDGIDLDLIVAKKKI